MGYKYIAIEALVPVNTSGILEVLEKVSPIIKGKVAVTYLELLV